jgi:hypothetical protein
MFGLTAENISESEYQSLWHLVEVGLGGYVFLRGGKQMIEAAAPIFSKK